MGASSLTEGRARSSRTDSAGSGGPSDVAMVEATDFANRDDPAEFRPLNWPAVGWILVEREVSTRPVVVREVASQGAAQVPFAKDEDVIQTLASHRADEPLHEQILPRAVGLREDFDPHALHAVPKPLAVDLVTVAQEMGRQGVVRESVQLGVGPSFFCTRRAAAAGQGSRSQAGGGRRRRRGRVEAGGAGE